ncbi:MAG: FHA domain-containing protein [Clostridia bacterium]|nr:FHA domain-containing protein [Clostridia bacterium]
MPSDIISFSRIAMPVLAGLILLLCVSALFKRRPVSLGGAKLIDAQTKEVFPLTRRETSLGRNKNCDIVINEATVSRLHAVIVCAKDGWYVADTKSQAGVRINGKKIERKAYIKTGDAITLGSVTLFFENIRN